MTIAYFDGGFQPLDEVRVSPLDRGYLLADGVYEVIPVYAGRLFRLDEHLDRLERSLAAIRIPDPLGREGWRAMLAELVARNGGGEQAVYLQVTRGVAPRNHAFPADAEPTVLAMTRVVAGRAAPGPISAITREDNRWGRCDVKAIALLANVLLRQEAVEAGAAETILLRDGRVTEGAASNVFVVRGDGVATPPKGPEILAGITRDVVIELAREAGLAVEERDVAEAELRSADEIWVTSSSMEATPVTWLDGERVGGGQPGPAWRRVFERLAALKARLAAGT